MIPAPGALPVAEATAAIVWGPGQLEMYPIMIIGSARAGCLSPGPTPGPSLPATSALGDGTTGPYGPGPRPTSY
jgi:hypothetical protein